METTLDGNDSTECHWITAASQAAAIVARKRRLDPTDAEDLKSEVWLKVLERDGAVMKKFEARSSLQAYLVSVADRCVLDRRVRELGKWRPSKRARSSGALAVRLERMTHREGTLMAEAIAAISLSTEVDRETIRLAAEAVSPRRPSRRCVQLDDNAPIASRGETPYDAVEAKRRDERARQIENALRLGLARMTPEDLRLLTRRFVAEETVASIAKEEHRQQKALYRTYEHLCRRLRSHLTGLGVTVQDVRSMLHSPTG